MRSPIATDWNPRGRHLAVFDAIAVVLSVIAAFGLRFDANDVADRMGPFMPVAYLPVLVFPPILAIFGLYRREWRYASVREMVAITGAILVGTGVTFVIQLVLGALGAPGTLGFPRSVFVIEALLLLAFIGGGRFALRARLEQIGRDETERGSPAIVYGAAEAGAMITRVTDRDPKAGAHVVGFLDDDPGKVGRVLLGRRIEGGLAELPALVRKTGARQLIVAMPDARGSVIRAAVEAARGVGIEVRTVAAPRDLLSVTPESGLTLQKLSVEDLLRRAPFEIDIELVTSYLNGASVLVTGGGGSIGGELVRQIHGLGPRLLTVVDQHEEALWAMDAALSQRGTARGPGSFEMVLADVRSPDAMNDVIARAKPDVVFHAAALKHVPIVEVQPSEGVLTNVVGTLNVLRACEAAKVRRFVLISTDKAVEAVGAMGLTKRVAEHLTLATAERIGRPYVAVRFGNVLGSSGSVVLTFQRQLAEGLPLTVTHPDVTRYFMTIGEAVSLILEAAAHPSGGEVYVLDMGEPTKIVDLARDLIRLSGLDPDDVPIVYTGLRAGERLHETLLHDDEAMEPTEHPGLLRARLRSVPDPSLVMDLVDRLATAAAHGDDDSVRALLRTVPGLTSADHVTAADQVPPSRSSRIVAS